MNNCLITKRGRVVDVSGNGQHEIICVRKLGVKLRTFLLKKGGVRVKLGWPNTESLAIEYYRKPTEHQLRAIRKILRADDYYTVVLNLKTIAKWRPIRSFTI